ncbi:hypothetical protein COV16_02945 [Candidatus Woesearchaeota archaeon CG10_big_fil_rev_8_21_14_0_10_34_8]|nr:MAG: hypothetical protein COV16_02945 [Candidatus Woesearchaeota archaeon CG10_big_fil_rev_8_21_14_0_10_34_8]
MNKKELKRLDIILLILFPLLAVIISLAIKANFLTSALLFYGVPAIWLSYRTKHMIKKTALFSIILTVPFTIVIDYIATIDKAWTVIVSIFPYRLFGVIPIEDFIFGFIFVYSIIIFYEHFLDKGKHKLIDKRMKYFIMPLILMLIVFFFVLITTPEILVIKYAYLWLGIIFLLIPTVTFLSFFPRLLSKYAKTAVYFFIIAFLFELTALQLNQWTFEGVHFIGWFEVLGHRFPIEEPIFYFTLCTTAILSYFEFFDDDRK